MNWHTAYIDGEPSRFRTTDEGAAALPGGHMTRLQFGEWASKWPCDGMFAAGCVHEYLQSKRGERYHEHGCCNERGPTVHGCRHGGWECHYDQCRAIRELAESVTDEMLDELIAACRGIYEFEEWEECDGDD